MNAKTLARLFVLTVALAGAIGVLSGKVPVALVAVAVVLVNGGVVAWLKWHEEQDHGFHNGHGR